ncbi:DUF3140 domain-containing protein [Streptomyces sp. NPDC092296]|uniref:DUF3140 domain-containing protein n=1 Tax=Streptomyces sp. NPDC092296 TaxID=3366012 RepID=UPI0037F5629B
MAAEVSQQLWTDFHTVVNMTSRQLEEWLRTRDAGEDAEGLPDQAGPLTGRRVLAVLGKRRTDLTDEDAAVMRRVVAEVRAKRSVELDPKAGDPGWRHRLMSIGHDPLKPG